MTDSFCTDKKNKIVFMPDSSMSGIFFFIFSLDYSNKV